MLFSCQWFILLLAPIFVANVTASSPWAMSWASESFGPDGPWQAVKVSIGSNDTTINLYPGASWGTYILLSDICLNSSYCYATEAGLFNPHDSDTHDDSAIYLAPNGWSGLEIGYTDAVPVYADAHRALDNMDLGGIQVSTINMIAISQGYQIYPNGKNYPLEVGLLSLGSPDVNQTFSTNFGAAINGTFVTSWLYQHGDIPSYSYGMHIGSVSPEIPGSLYLGGYDQSRAIGEISTQSTDSGAFPIQLVDISIGTATGNSPWNSSTTTGLLAQGNASLAQGLQVNVDPTNPYIYLPSSSCGAIASKLPVTYNSDLGLYLWDQSSAMYSQIVTSPAYLAFSFKKDGGDDEQLTIKVPFALLNLTLDAPLMTDPTPYFPCMGTDSDSALGRAFLQAAFLGVQWPNQTWFLAQAPGPQIQSIGQPLSIEDGTTTISGSNSKWEDTWKGDWTPISNSSSASSSSAGNTGGLSTGTKAGVGVGCSVAGLSIIAFIIWLVRRRSSKGVPDSNVAPVEKGPSDSHVAPQMTPVEAPDTKKTRVAEMNNTTVHEMD